MASTETIGATSEDGSAELDAGTGAVLSLCLAIFMVVLNYLAPTAFFPDMADDLDTSVSVLGQFLTVMILVSGVAGIAVGPLSDHFGYRWPLVAGTVVIGLNLICMSATPSLWPLFALGVVAGVADAVVFGMAFAIAGARYTGEAQRKAISWVVASLSAVSIVGIPLVTALGEAFGWRAALLCSGGVALAGAWLLAITVPPDPSHDRPPWRTSDLIESYQPLMKHTPTLRLYGIVFLRSAGWIGLFTFLGSFAQEHIGLSVRSAGFVYTIAGIGTALGSVIAGHRFRSRSPRVVVTVMLAASGLGIVAIAVVSSVPMTFVLIFAAGLVSGISGTLITTLLAAESPAGPGTTMVLNGSIINFGTAIGIGLGGLALAIGGYSLAGLGFALLVFAAAALSGWPTAKVSALQPVPAAGIKSPRAD